MGPWLNSPRNQGKCRFWLVCDHDVNQRELVVKIKEPLIKFNKKSWEMLVWMDCDYDGNQRRQYNSDKSSMPDGNQRNIWLNSTRNQSNIGIEWNVAMIGMNGDKFLVTRNQLVMNITGTFDWIQQEIKGNLGLIVCDHDVNQRGIIHGKIFFW